MKRYTLPVLVLLLLAFQSLPLSAAETHNTGAFECTQDGAELNRIEWKTGKPMIVRKAQVWLGMYSGSVADFGFALMNGERFIVPRMNWDHYEDPTGLNDQLVTISFAPDFLIVLPGQTLTLYYRCQTFSEHPAAGHVIVYIWSFP